MLHSLSFGDALIFLWSILHIDMHWLRTCCSNNIAVHIMVPLYGICMLQIKSNQIKFDLKLAMYIWKKRKLAESYLLDYIL